MRFSARGWSVQDVFLKKKKDQEHVEYDCFCTEQRI